MTQGVDSGANSKILGGYNYVLGLGNDTLGTQATLPGGGISAGSFRDLDGDSRTDYAVIDWFTNQLGIGFRLEAGRTVLPRLRRIWQPTSAAFPTGATVSSPLLVKASGNSPAGVNQLQVWIDANDKYIGHAIAAVSVTSPID